MRTPARRHVESPRRFDGGIPSLDDNPALSGGTTLTDRPTTRWALCDGECECMCMCVSMSVYIYYIYIYILYTMVKDVIVGRRSVGSPLCEHWRDHDGTPSSGSPAARSGRRHGDSVALRAVPWGGGIRPTESSEDHRAHGSCRSSSRGPVGCRSVPHSLARLSLSRSLSHTHTRILARSLSLSLVTVRFIHPTNERSIYLRINIYLYRYSSVSFSFIY